MRFSGLWSDPRPFRDRATDLPVAGEDIFQDALAASQSRPQLLQPGYPGRRDLTLERARRRPGFCFRGMALSRASGQDRRPRSGRHLEAEVVYRFVHGGARLPEGLMTTSGVRLRKSPAVLDMLLSKVTWAWLCRGQ